nr:tetratricopeptide repeat protein [Melioribacteraceae bacterium]
KNVKEQNRIAEINHNLGMTYLKIGKYKEAINEFENSLKISEIENFIQIMGITYLSLADIYQLMGNMEKAISSADSALEMSNKINDRLTIADIYKVKAVIDKKRNNYAVAENYLLTSLRINKELKNKLNTAETDFELGLLYKDMKKPSGANNHFKLALHYYNECGCQTEIARIREHIN